MRNAANGDREVVTNPFLLANRIIHIRVLISEALLVANIVIEMHIQFAVSFKILDMCLLLFVIWLRTCGEGNLNWHVDQDILLHLAIMVVYLNYCIIFQKLCHHQLLM